MQRPKTPIKKPPQAKPSVATAPGEVRIIGGEWKRSKIAVLTKPGLRPTPDRVRETLFNWLGQDLTGWRCIDVFAGSGVLGLECASRGAEHALLCESERALADAIEKTALRLKASTVRVQRGDGLQALRAGAPWHLVLLDPPFDSELFEPALAAAAASTAPNAWVYLEAPREFTDATLLAHGLVRRKHLKAGQVHAHLLQKG